MKINEWKKHEFSTGCTTGEDYKKFQHQMKSDLKKQAAKEGLELHRFNPNHYEFSAVLSKNFDSETRFVFVSISDVRFFKNQWADHVLVRTMAHDHDWTGGRNTFCRWEDVAEHAVSLLKH